MKMCACGGNKITKQCNLVKHKIPLINYISNTLIIATIQVLMPYNLITQLHITKNSAVGSWTRYACCQVRNIDI